MAGLYSPQSLFGSLFPIVRRRVFFSFHYQADHWRVNQVRNSWRFRHEGERQAFGFYDGSIWESSQRTGPDSLKELIRGGLDNTSVTCVLVGSNTYRRRWVRYEIARSIVKGNGLLVVRIHNMQNQLRQVSQIGPNPLDYMGVYRANDGRILLAELNPQLQWVAYSDYTQGVVLPKTWQQPTNEVLALSRYATSHDYVTDNGYLNFPNWVANCARNTGL